MTVALRLPSGTVLVPFDPSRLFGPDTANPFSTSAKGATLVESPSVHMDPTGKLVVLNDGVDRFVVLGPDRVETVEEFKHYQLRFPVDDLPVFAGEPEMAELRKEWVNIDDMYRKVIERTSVPCKDSACVSLEDYRVVDVAADVVEVPSDVPVEWEVDPEYAAVPRSLSALVPGRLREVPQMVADALNENAKAHGVKNTKVARPYPGRSETTITVERDITYADERTKRVKANPLNNRRNARRIDIPDTRYVKITVQVPLSVRAPSFMAALDEVKAIEAAVTPVVTAPVRVCTTCKGDGMVLPDGFTDRY